MNIKLLVCLLCFGITLHVTFFHVTAFAQGDNSDGLIGHDELPEVPAIFRSVTGIIDKEFSGPHMPLLRLSKDGRIALKAGTAYVVRPTAVNSAVVDQKRGVVENLINFEEGVPLPFAAREIAVCEPNTGNPVSGMKNPYMCGVSGKDDCYDLNIVTQRKKFGEYEEVLSLHNVFTTIRVVNPKTPNARIAEVTHKDISQRLPYLTWLLVEPMTPADGRLLIGRTELQTLSWYNENTDSYETGENIDIVYSYIEEPHQPCDVSQWKEFKPISHAPYDKRINQRYKFASQPFRDASGRIIPDGEDMQGSYPWIDKEAANLSMLMGTELLEEIDLDGNVITSRYPTRCVIEGCTDEGGADIEQRSNFAGLAIFGAWTQGKVILVDGLLNDIDFKIGMADEKHRYVSLYKPGSGLTGEENGEVRVGSVRQESGLLEREIYDGPTGYHFASFFDSFEQRLNFWQPLRPVSPKDVTWLASTGRHTVELAFDDYLNPNAFIVSNMVGLLDRLDRDPRSARFAADYKDGWSVADQAFTQEVRVQNSAAALPEFWHIPRSGKLHNARIEPVALGGVRGRGIWLNGEGAYLSYDIEEQPRRVSAFPWSVGLFLDPRGEGDRKDGTEEALLQFPDGTVLSLLNRRVILYRDAEGELLHDIQLPTHLENKQWVHVALNIHPGGKRIKFLLNGMLYNTFNSVQPIFQMDSGEMHVGSARVQGAEVVNFRGWLDEFKVFARQFTPEVDCNNAYGTLIGLPKTYEGDWKPLAQRYPALTHEYMNNALTMRGKETYPLYACYLDNSWDYAAHLANYPEGTVSLRSAINFPEGPLYFDSPRPDSVFNSFCLDCHHETGQVGLTIDALRYKAGISAQHDSRRQPLQPPALVRGNLPVGWLGLGWGQQVGQQGTPIDPFIMPSIEGRQPQIKGLTLVNADTGYDIMPLLDGTTIDLSALPSPRVNIRAVVNSITQRVDFNFNGQQSFEIGAPFALFGIENNQYIGEKLNLGSHQISADVDGSHHEVTFTVVGAEVESETGNASVDRVLVEPKSLVQEMLDRLSILDWFVVQLQTLSEAIIGLPETVAEFISELLKYFDGEEKEGVSNISVYQAIKHGEDIRIEGLISGAEDQTLYINDQQVELLNGRFDFRTEHTAGQLYRLKAYDTQGLFEETLISFEYERIAKGLSVRLDHDSELLTRLGDELMATLVPELIGGLQSIDIGLVNIGIYESTVHVESIKIGEAGMLATTGEVSADNMNIAGRLNVDDVEVDGYMMHKVCIPFTRWCWQQAGAFNATTTLGSDFNVAITKGTDKDALLKIGNVSASVELQGTALSVYSLPRWLFDPIFRFIEWLIADPLKEMLTNVVSNFALDLINNEINPLLALFVTTERQPLPGFATHQSELDDVIRLVSEVLPRGTTFAFDMQRAETTDTSIVTELDGRMLSATFDRQIYYCYRVEDWPEISIDDVDTSNIHQDAMFLIKAQQFNQAFSAAAQERRLDFTMEKYLGEVLDVASVVSGYMESSTYSSDSPKEILAIAEAFNMQSHVIQQEIDLIAQSVTVEAKVSSSPYINGVKDGALANVAYDHVVISVYTQGSEPSDKTMLFQYDVDIEVAFNLLHVPGDTVPGLDVESLQYDIIEKRSFDATIPEVFLDTVSENIMDEVLEGILTKLAVQFSFLNTDAVAKEIGIPEIQRVWFRPKGDS
ncbi:hypothetical protein A9Q81_09150, partial [Gammaproteobacteria bacterium 42_54_T18]